MSNILKADYFSNPIFLNSSSSTVSGITNPPGTSKSISQHSPTLTPKPTINAHRYIKILNSAHTITKPKPLQAPKLQFVANLHNTTRLTGKVLIGYDIAGSTGLTLGTPDGHRHISILNALLHNVVLEHFQEANTPPPSISLGDCSIFLVDPNEVKALRSKIQRAYQSYTSNNNLRNIGLYLTDLTEEQMQDSPVNAFIHNNQILSIDGAGVRLFEKQLKENKLQLQVVTESSSSLDMANNPTVIERINKACHICILKVPSKSLGNLLTNLYINLVGEAIEPDILSGDWIKVYGCLENDNILVLTLSSELRNKETVKGLIEPYIPVEGAMIELKDGIDRVRLSNGTMLLVHPAYTLSATYHKLVEKHLKEYCALNKIDPDNLKEQQKLDKQIVDAFYNDFNTQTNLKTLLRIYERKFLNNESVTIENFLAAIFAEIHRRKVIDGKADVNRGLMTHLSDEVFKLLDNNHERDMVIETIVNEKLKKEILNLNLEKFNQELESRTEFINSLNEHIKTKLEKLTVTSELAIAS